MSLSPWDLSGNISFDFSLYRPRRPSYVYATQSARRRNESYRHATKSDNSCEPVTEDFIEGIQQARKQRKEHCPNKFGKAHGPGEGIELRQVDIINHVGGPLRPRALSTPNEEDEGDYESKDGSEDVFGGISAVTIHVPVNSVASTSVTHGADDQEPEGPGETIFKSTDDPKVFNKSQWRYRKNLIVLSLSFILVFTAFRSIQNLQSSLNQAGHLGVIAMGCVHVTMFLTCLFAPVLINKLTSKWTIVLGLLFYLFWIAANFYPHFYTLIPTSIGVGFGQSLAWGAQVTYIQKLAVDYAHLSKELTHQELSKFNGIFLACFQTTHIWGNVISSLMLAPSQSKAPMHDSMLLPPCGVYDYCEDRASNSIWNTTVSSASEDVLKLMGSYIVFAFTGFILILLFLEKIGAKSDPEKPCLQMVWSNVRHLATHKTYRLLIPLLIFNGFEQGFVYADYTNSYVSCTIGVEYVGYNMITLGTANSVFSILVGMVARHVPREAVIGIGSILHIGLMVFLLVWIPDEKLFAVFFVISGLWGICDAIWQTQCNCLVNLSCPDDHDVAFQNFRMLQGLGAALAFMLGAFVCVSVKLYIIISLMVLAIMCYCIAEYRIRRENGELDDSS